MTKANPMRVYRITVLVVAILSVAIGLLIVNLTGHVVLVFVGQLLVASVLGLWYRRMTKHVTAGR